ncbi:MAG: hypothetical protein U0M13_12835 [Desulfovibrio fairfieldensis]|nr:hypothetical protein [Desulfovibrio fairfieldensis]
MVKTIGGLFAFQMPESGITLIAKILSRVLLSIFGGSSEKKRGFSLTHGGCAAARPSRFCVPNFLN